MHENDPSSTGPRDRKPSMIRAIALATMLGALIASVAVYTINPNRWRDMRSNLALTAFRL